MTSNNILFHFLLYKFVPNIHTYEHHIRSKTEFIFEPERVKYTDFINCHFADSFLIDKKFTCLNNFLNNTFITKEKKESFLHYFNITQRCYYKLRKLYHIYKTNKSKIYNNDHDLFLTPLNHSKNNIIIVQENTSYIFKINDLIRIIIEGLTYTYDMFLEPKASRNPYNNIEFTTCELYNIYLYIVINTFITPPHLLQAYFKCEFNMAKFLLFNESYLKDLAIEKFINELDENDEDDKDKLYENIINMTEKTNIITISDTYPSDDVITKLKHCLPDFLFSEYSYNPSKRRIHKRKMLSKLKEFHKFNPRYGRTYFRVNRNWMNTMSQRDEEERNMSQELNDTISVNNDTIVNNDTVVNNDTIVNNDNLQPNRQTNDTVIDNTIMDNIWIDAVLEANTLLNSRSIDIESYRTNLLTDNDNLISTSRSVYNYSFNSPSPRINERTMNNIVSNNIITSPTSSLDINEISNQPYDASIGPFSPSSSNSSLSPTSRNLNILNTTEFNINNNDEDEPRTL